MCASVGRRGFISERKLTLFGESKCMYAIHPIPFQDTVCLFVLYSPSSHQVVASSKLSSHNLSSGNQQRT
jgi:hypothetical protein